MKSTAELDRDLYSALKSYLESFASHLPVRRVAVVGNAPLEPSRERAALIDSSDLVFRCNSFVLDEPGAEPCLGRKTDVVVTARATRTTPWFFDGYPSRAYLVVDMASARAKSLPVERLGWPDDLGGWPIPNRLLGLPLKRMIRPETNGVGAVPTTGTESAYVAHEMFPEAQLTLIGYSFLHNREQKKWKHHWGSTGTVHVHGAHRLDREGALLQSWVDDGSAVHVP